MLPPKSIFRYPFLKTSCTDVDSPNDQLAIRYMPYLNWALFVGHLYQRTLVVEAHMIVEKMIFPANLVGLHHRPA